MPIESQLNGRIATLLDRMNPRWTALGENKGAFRGSQKQPDVVIAYRWGGQPVVIENEYVPARNVEAESLARLGEWLSTSVVGASGEINAVIALKSPLDLRNAVGADDVDALLHGGITLEYALFTGTSAEKYTRFPQRGFIAGNLRDLAAFVEYAANSESAVENAVTILEAGVQDAAAVLYQAAEYSDDTKQAIAARLKQEYSEQTLRMAATIMINALVFHQNLAGQHGVRNLSQIKYDGLLTQSAIVDEWRKILKVNYWPIFKIARALLLDINSPRLAADALKFMADTAEKLVALSVDQSHDLSGTVFQRLIADRKFLATFYTRPEAATLLAHLAIPDDDRWHDPEQVKDFRIADYACGTGTLIHAAYRRVNQLHRLASGDPERLHAAMMEHALTACDVLPSAVHLTASMLSSSYPQQRYTRSRTIIAEYGKTGRTKHGGVSLGSLDLLGSNGEVRPLIPLHSATAVTGTGEVHAELGVDMPPYSQNLVIMNPPFTRSGSDWDGQIGQSYQAKQFHGLSVDRETQTRMSALAREYGKGTCAHGYAGIASWFVALADRMVRKGGTIALVLPMTALQGASWQKVRQLIARNYRDAIVLTIAAARQDNQAFSADTGMAETMLVCRESSSSPGKRGLFVSLQRRPKSEMEATALAKAITALARNPALKTLEDGPYGGLPLVVGEEQLGEAVDAPLSRDAPWSAIGIADFSVAQTAYQLAQGTLWLPRMQEQEALHISMATIRQTGQVGISHKDIVGRGSRTAFDLLRPPSGTATYPMLWGHNAKLQRNLVVAPDSEGRVKVGRKSRAAQIWDTRSHAHHNADFRFNSQPLTVAFTEQRTIGGTAWKNVRFTERVHEIAYSLWGNSTLGLLCYWWHSTRQQAGRGRMPVMAIRTMPTLDVTRLTPRQLETAAAIFDDMRERTFLPANEAYRDTSRQELDHRVLIEVLGLPESLLEPLELLRHKWCSEPSVHGGKRTAPPGAAG